MVITSPFRNWNYGRIQELLDFRSGSIGLGLVSMLLLGLFQVFVRDEPRKRLLWRNQSSAVRDEAGLLRNSARRHAL